MSTGAAKKRRCNSPSPFVKEPHVLEYNVRHMNPEAIKKKEIPGITPSCEMNLKEMRPGTPYWWYENRNKLFPQTLSEIHEAG